MRPRSKGRMPRWRGTATREAAYRIMRLTGKVNAKPVRFNRHRFPARTLLLGGCQWQKGKPMRVNLWNVPQYHYFHDGTPVQVYADDPGVDEVIGHLRY